MHKVIAINIEININVPFEYFLSKIMLVGTFASNNGFKIGTQFYDLTRLGLQCQTPASLLKYFVWCLTQPYI